MKNLKNRYYRWQEGIAITVSVIYIVALMVCINLASCTAYKPTTRMVPEIMSADHWNYQLNKEKEPSLTQSKILETMDDI